MTSWVVKRKFLGEKKRRSAGSADTEQENNHCGVVETDKDNELLHCFAKMFFRLSKLFFLKSCCHENFPLVIVITDAILKPIAHFGNSTVL